MQVWGVTDRGAVRQQNQDAYAAKVLEDGQVIALASTMAVELFMEEFLKPGQEGPVEEQMGHAAAVANQAVFQRSATDPECAGMGTTMVAALAGPSSSTRETAEPTTSTARASSWSPGTTPWWRTWWSGAS